MMGVVHRYGGVEVATLHAEILLEVVETSLGDGVSVDVVEEVHDAKTWLRFLSKMRLN